MEDNESKMHEFPSISKEKVFIITKDWLVIKGANFFKKNEVADIEKNYNWLKWNYYSFNFSWLITPNFLMLNDYI